MTAGPEILHDRLPADAVAFALPGTRPMPEGDWLRIDEAFHAQMVLRTQLIALRREDVIALDPRAIPAASELLDLVVAELVLRHGYRRKGDEIWRPDGVVLRLDPDDPLGSIGHLCQEDFCLLLPGETGHVLCGAVLCFPSSWMLSEKMGRDLTSIHGPVADYDGAMARRVQRLFDGVKVGHPLVRFNRLPQARGALYQPKSDRLPRRDHHPSLPFLRSERQVLLRLPTTRAVVFSIHTYLARSAA
ncbi:uncharacterized protein DUF3445 [Palleronia aestuarii]|uniref:Uncharacterized protein DUF3445 n=1 Tax=Palleronia aestuarii TaxID=568105 RepID=A0A2W7NB17_9RHOB|nr:DUF3445 domain-containing protein [Palleronia aestuarii]PZX17615.1 uncharacterized protein DUF3445 [Palleronia aestuarii]